MKSTDDLESVSPARATKIFRDMEHMPYEKKLQAGSANPAEEKVQRRPYCHLQIPNGSL